MGAEVTYIRVSPNFFFQKNYLIFVLSNNFHAVSDVGDKEDGSFRWQQSKPART